MNINQIVDDILTRWGKIDIFDPKYATYKETLKDQVKNQTAVFIRQDLDRNGRSDGFMTRIEAELVPVTIGHNVKCLRTKNKVSEPVRLKGDSDYAYIGSVDGLQPFSVVDFYEMNDISCLEISAGNPRYSQKNNYIYILNTTNEMEHVAIEAAFIEIIDGDLNVDDVRDYNVTYEFPATRDMIHRVSSYVLADLRGAHTTSSRPITSTTRTE